jgi:STE24 endopeptidase
MTFVLSVLIRISHQTEILNFAPMPSASVLFIIFISILVFEYLLGLWLDYLNIKNWDGKLPKELDGICDEEKYKLSQSYHLTKKKFSFISGTFSLLLMLALLFFDGFAVVDEWARSQSDSPIGQALLFFGLLAFAADLLSTPFSVYNTFVIEEKYGFNRTTIPTYISDKIKRWLLGAIIGGGLLSLIVLFFEAEPNYFWVYAWIVIGAFSIVSSMLYASVILPLFNKLTPLEEGELRTAIESYCKKIGYQLTHVYVIDGSKRSSKANAFFTGLGPKKKVVLYDTLIEKQTTEELVAILAHEVGHYKKKHIPVSTVLSLALTGLMLFMLSLFIHSPELAEALGAKEQSFYIGMLGFSLLYSPVSTIIGIGMNIVSRKNEYEADAFAKETYNSEAMQSALKKLSVDNLSNFTPHPWYVFFYYSHPSLLQRLNALKG